MLSHVSNAKGHPVGEMWIFHPRSPKARDRGHPRGEERLESEALVAAVANYRGLGVLAAAEIDGRGFGGFEPHRSEISALVAAVAEGLVGAQAAGAPEVAFAGFHGDGVGASLGNGRFRHAESPCLRVFRNYHLRLRCFLRQ